MRAQPRPYVVTVRSRDGEQIEVREVLGTLWDVKHVLTGAGLFSPGRVAEVRRARGRAVVARFVATETPRRLWLRAAS